MKQVENSFVITGFVAKDAEIRHIHQKRCSPFPVGYRRKETKGNETTRVSAFLSVEAWRKSGSASFELLKKGSLLTIEGYLSRRVDRQKRHQAKRHQVGGQQVL